MQPPSTDRRAARRLGRRLHNSLVALSAACALFWAVADWQANRAPQDLADKVQQRQAAFPLLLLATVLGSLLVYAFMPKPPKPKPAALSEFDVPQAREGQEYVWIFGEVLVRDPTIAWWGNFDSKPIKSKTSKK